MVVAEEDKEAFVDQRRVVELFMGVAGAERRDGGVECRGVAEAGVEIAGGERTGRTADGAGSRQRCAMDERRLAPFFWPQFAGEIDLRPGDVSVHVHAAGHHDEAGGVEHSIRRAGGVSTRRGDDLAVPNPQVHHDAVDAVDGVVDDSVGDFEKGHYGFLQHLESNAGLAERINGLLA